VSRAMARLTQRKPRLPRAPRTPAGLPSFSPRARAATRAASVRVTAERHAVCRRGWAVRAGAAVQSADRVCRFFIGFARIPPPSTISSRQVMDARCWSPTNTCARLSSTQGARFARSMLSQSEKCAIATRAESDRTISSIHAEDSPPRTADLHRFGELIRRCASCRGCAP